jgi:hypothetical protein
VENSVDLIVQLLLLLGTMSIGICVSKASMQVVFRIMRVAALPSKPDPVPGLPITSNAPLHTRVPSEQEVV